MDGHPALLKAQARFGTQPLLVFGQTILALYTMEEIKMFAASSSRAKLRSFTAVVLMAVVFAAASMMAHVEAGPTSNISVALFKDADPWGSVANEVVLALYGMPYTVFNSSHMGDVDLSGYSKVIIAADQPQAFYDAMNVSIGWFEEYVEDGGVLEVHAADSGFNGGHWTGLLPGGLQYIDQSRDLVDIVDPTHPVVLTPNRITDAELDNWFASVHGYFNDTYPAESRVVLTEQSTGLPVYVEFDYGLGQIIASSQTLEYGYEYGRSLILENSVLLYSQQETLDVHLDVGAIHFRGEIAEFYVQTVLNGVPVNATITRAVLYHSEGQASVDLTLNAQHVSTGLCRIPYAVPTDAPTGTYMLTIDVRARGRGMYACARGTGAKSFLLSSTLTSTNALITEVSNDIATVVIPELGAIRVNLTEIHATIIAIDGKTATVQTDIGTMKVDLSTVNTKVTDFEDDIGTVKDRIDELDETTHRPTYWFSLAAAILAGLSTALLIGILVLRSRGR